MNLGGLGGLGELEELGELGELEKLGGLEKLGELEKLERLEELDNNKVARQLTKPNACPFVNLSTRQLAPSSTNHLFSL